MDKIFNAMQFVVTDSLQDGHQYNNMQPVLAKTFNRMSTM
jgi:hypothetical protein